MSTDKVLMITRGTAVTTFACFMGYLLVKLISYLEYLEHCKWPGM